MHQPSHKCHSPAWRCLRLVRRRQNHAEMCSAIVEDVTDTVLAAFHGHHFSRRCRGRLSAFAELGTDSVGVVGGTGSATIPTPSRMALRHSLAYSSSNCSDKY